MYNIRWIILVQNLVDESVDLSSNIALLSSWILQMGSMHR